MNEFNYDLWILGDSFTERSPNVPYWTDILIKNFNGYNMYLNACPGRDVQTIMDILYKNLMNITENSLVIIFLPSLARLRYPKNSKYFHLDIESGWHKEIRDNNKHNFNELFLHHPNNETNTKFRDELDFPFNLFKLDDVNESKVNYLYLDIEKNEEDYLNPSNIDYAKFLVANEACLKNWNDIFFSLKKYSKFKLLFYSWTDEFDYTIVQTKKIIKNKIGIWHTNDDEYKDSNGKFGLECDEHFSPKMHKLFAELIIKENKSYFKTYDY